MLKTRGGHSYSCVVRQRCVHDTAIFGFQVRLEIGSIGKKKAHGKSPAALGNHKKSAQERPNRRKAAPNRPKGRH